MNNDWVLAFALGAFFYAFGAALLVYRLKQVFDRRDKLRQ